MYIYIYIYISSHNDAFMYMYHMYMSILYLLRRCPAGPTTARMSPDSYYYITNIMMHTIIVITIILMIIILLLLLLIIMIEIVKFSLEGETRGAHVPRLRWSGAAASPRPWRLLSITIDNYYHDR